MPAIYHEGSWLGNATDPEVLVKDTVGWTGKNLIDVSKTVPSKAGATITNLTTSGFTVTGNNVTYGASRTPLLLEVNKRYIASVTLISNDGSGARMAIRDSSNTIKVTAMLNEPGEYKFEFTYQAGYYFSVFATFEPAASGSVTVDNVMIRRADITDPTYEPYHESVEEEIEQIYADNGVLGAKNRLKYSSNVYTKTISGVTFTLNSDNSLSLSGTASENIFFNLVNASDVPKSEAQILSGCPKGGSLTTYALRWNTGGSNLYDNGDGVVIPANTVLQAIEIRIQSGYNTNGLTFKPMLRLASDPDDTYQPYAMTNRELTEKAETLKSVRTWDSTTGIVLLKYGNIVTVNFDGMTAVTKGVDEAFFTLPEGYRPRDIIQFVEPLNNRRIVISTNGQISSKVALNNAYIRGYATFIVM